MDWRKFAGWDLQKEIYRDVIRNCEIALVSELKHPCKWVYCIMTLSNNIFNLKISKCQNNSK